MKKEWILGMAAAGIALLILPWLVISFVNTDGSMMATILLLFAVNPACFVFEGIFAGSRWRQLWGLPFLFALFFLTGALGILGMDLASALLYGGVYLMLGLAAFFVAAILENRRMK